jgi:hypothetical protein
MEISDKFDYYYGCKLLIDGQAEVQHSFKVDSGVWIPSPVVQ